MATVEAVAQRAAGDLHAGRVGGHARHRQPGLVGPVGLELLQGDGPGLGEGGVQRDGVVADGEQEPVAVLPVRVLGAVAELVGVGHGEDVRDAEGLADVALALDLAHLQGVVPDAVGGGAEAVDPLAPRSLLGRRVLVRWWCWGMSRGWSFRSVWSERGQCDELAGTGSLSGLGR